MELELRKVTEEPKDVPDVSMVDHTYSVPSSTRPEEVPEDDTGATAPQRPSPYVFAAPTSQWKKKSRRKSSTIQRSMKGKRKYDCRAAVLRKLKAHADEEFYQSIL